jgi:hypothetical protein
MRRRFVRSGLELVHFGLLHETPPGGAPTGDPAPAGDKGGGTEGGGTGASSGGAPAPAPAADGQAVPYARFKEVNDELQKRRQADEQREADEQRKRGEYEKVADAEKAKRETAEQQRDSTRRELIFTIAASGKVSDMAAAYKLANADGVLSAIELDADGRAKDPKAVEAAITELVKTYAFLKPGAPTTGPGYGRDHGGNGAQPGTDVERLSTRERMELGIRQDMTAKGLAPRR